MWSTEEINKLYNAIDIKRELSIANILNELGNFKNPFYQNDIHIRASFIEFDYSDSEKANLINLRKDVNGFYKLLNIKLYEHQKETIENIYNYKLNCIIHSRQSGTSTSLALAILYFILCNFDKAVGITSHINITAEEIIEKIKFYYESLPYYVKPGVIKWRKDYIKFDNGCYIRVGTSLVGATYDMIVLNRFSFYKNSRAEQLLNSLIPITSAHPSAKLIFASCPNGINKFMKIAVGNNDNYKRQWIPWYLVPGRDDSWKKEMINTLGSYGSFLQEYELLFQNTPEWRRALNLNYLV